MAKAHLFDSATAKDLAIKGAAQRKANFAALKAKAELCDKLADQIAELTKVKPEVKPEHEFVSPTLVRVRKQIEMVLDSLETEQDAQKVDRLSSALSRLADIEQKLSGRPLPGSLRPTSVKPKREQSRVEPLD